jgi:ribose transport system ATP-binding protein|tara:strand:- start:647 stop:2185 length:1539 start_codon:yes stop_codon:yes gene_type:complete
MNDGRRLFVARGIRKSYEVPVLLGVDMDIQAGEFHGLIGENGAGKSTLVNIISGLTGVSGGTMTLAGQPLHPATRGEASDHGIRTVLQELTAVDTLTVGESIFIDALPHRWGWLKRDDLARDARPLLDNLGLTDLDPDQPMSSLGIGQKQMVEVAAALSQPCTLLILDEPTAALTDADAEKLFAALARLQRDGTAILYISHRLDEIRRLADRVTVLRDGTSVASKPTSALSTDDMIKLMVGRAVSEEVTRETPPTDKLALRVRNLRSAPAVRNVSFDVRWGEILGFAGLVGAGRTETMRAIYGADTPQAGDVFLGDDDTPTPVGSPQQAVEHGMAYLSEDRRHQGVLGHLSVRINMSLASLRRLAGKMGWIDHTAEHAATDRLIRRLGVKCASPDQPIERLSGGNQQKVLIARWLLREPRILIVDEPTRGIDPGARAEVHRLLAQLADAGCAVLLVSSDLRELTALSDRIAVLSKGKLVDTFEREAFDAERIMAAAFREHVGTDHQAERPAH